MAKEWITVLWAADAAARWHVHQRREGAAEEPTSITRSRWLSMWSEATEGKTSGLVIAAVLHDAIEDQEVPSEVIVEAFGKDVAKLVEEVTDDKTLEKQLRKDRQVANRLKPKFSSSRIKSATCGLLRQARPRAREVANGLTGVSERLEGEFNQAAREAERLTVLRR